MVVCQSSSLSLSLSRCAPNPKGIWAPENELDLIFYRSAGSSSSGGGGDRDKQ